VTDRERLLATLRYQPVDRVPDYEFGAWEQTIDRWHSEGLPEHLTDYWGAIPEYFRTDDFGHELNIRINIGLCPAYEYVVLEEKGDHIVVQDEEGVIAEMLRPELGASIPRYLRHSLETRADWEAIRDERLNPAAPERIPNDLDARCRVLQHGPSGVAAMVPSVHGA